MKYTPHRTSNDSCMTHNVGGREFSANNGGPLQPIRILGLIWRLLRILFQYGNQEIYYHLCGTVGDGSYDVPMEAENVEVRLTNCGPKVTIW